MDEARPSNPWNFLTEWNGAKRWHYWNDRQRSGQFPNSFIIRSTTSGGCVDHFFRQLRQLLAADRIYAERLFFNSSSSAGF